MSTQHHKSSGWSQNLTQETDPTHTLEVRQNFLREIRSRFNTVRGLIRQTVGYENDAFNLSTNQEPTERYDFPTDKEKTDAFINDLRTWIREEILEPVSFVDKREGNHWTSRFVLAAYLQGHNQAVGLLQQEGVSITPKDANELLRRPTDLNALRDLYTRTYENLNDITEDMADEIRTELTRGFAEGENPRKIADRLTKKVRDIQHTRAETLARTEVINSHAQSQLNTYESVGVDVVGHSYWKDADDSRVCPFCSRLDGTPIKLSEARSATVDWAVEEGWQPQTWRLIPPAHPQCRCTLIPAVGADPTELASLEDRMQEAFDDKATDPVV